MRSASNGNPDHLLRCGHFEVQGLGNLACKPCDIVVVNVAAILAQMGGYAIGTCRDGDLGRTHRVRMSAAACVPHSSDMINVNSKSKLRTRHKEVDQMRREKSLAAAAHAAIMSRDVRNDRANPRHTMIRSAFATTSFARSWAMMALRCLESNTSRSIVTEVKSGAERSM